MTAPPGWGIRLPEKIPARRALPWAWPMSSTQPMSVSNTTFLVDRLGLDCAPLQFVRELNQNAIEAITARRAAGWQDDGVIVWDVDWKLVEMHGLYKLQVSDNGCGMTGRQIETYINSLSSSSGIQGYSSNFGVGAKISAGKENPVGLVYKSWVDGHGVIATFWKDPVVGYGLKQYAVGDLYSHYAPIADDLKTTPIDSCGTSVSLLGNTEDENTYVKPDLKQKWLIQYLNSRYYELPPHVTIKVRDFSNADPANWPTSPDAEMGFRGSQLRTIEGMRHYLEKYTESRGSVQLKNATAHWFLMPDGLNVSGGVWDEKCHVAALFQAELYDVKRLREARAELISFGIIYGQNRVVLYVEPDTASLNVVANTARSSLLVSDGETGVPLPWAEWAAEFRSKMPQQIRTMMDQILSRADTGNYADEIKKRIQDVLELLKLARFRRTKTSTVRADGALPGGATGETDTPREPRTRTGSRTNTGGSRADLYAAFISETGDPAEQIRSKDNIPEVRWISVADNTRSPDQLEDRAAQFVQENNLILANADFRGFQRVMEVLAREYPHAAAADIKRTVQSWTALQLTEAVMGIRSLQGSPEWSSGDDLTAALSEEALTTTVMSRYATLSQMKRQLASRVGRNESPEIDEDQASAANA